MRVLRLATHNITHALHFDLNERRIKLSQQCLKEEAPSARHDYI